MLLIKRKEIAKLCLALARLSNVSNDSHNFILIKYMLFLFFGCSMKNYSATLKKTIT